MTTPASPPMPATAASQIPQPTRPAYDGAWIGGLVPALLGGVDASWLPGTVSGAAGVVLLVLDGLGWTLLDDHRARAPEMAAMEGRPITAVVPSTTAAALTSIATGAPPGEHGLVGYRIRVAGAPLNVLRWSTASGPDPVAAQPVPPFLGTTPPVVTRSEFRHSGFTVAHLRGGDIIGWKTPSALVEHVRGLASPRRRFVYAYYDGVDKVAHEYGLRSGFLPAEIAAADRLVGDVRDCLPSSWALLVTADHGQVHVDADGTVPLDDVSPMVSAYAGEGRLRTLHARPGAAADLRAACEHSYGDRAWVFSRDRLFDEGWLGPAAGLEVRGRVGDVVLAAREPVIFLDPDLPQEAAMRSHHGSLTPGEMLVPLLAGRGRA